MIGNEELVKILAINNLKRAVDHYGLEGTIECIERVYDGQLKIKEYMLFTFNKTFLKAIK